MVDAADAVQIASSDWMQGSEIARVAFCGKAVTESLQHLVWTAESTGRTDGDDVVIAYQLGRLLSRYQLVHDEVFTTIGRRSGDRCERIPAPPARRRVSAPHHRRWLTAGIRHEWRQRMRVCPAHTSSRAQAEHRLRPWRRAG